VLPQSYAAQAAAKAAAAKGGKDKKK